MPADAGRAHFSFSIDLAPATDSSDRTALSEITQGLLRIVQRHGVPTTWALSDWSNSSLLAQMSQIALGQEFALLADASWASPQGGAQRFGRELLRRVESARNSGWDLVTLALHGTEVREHADLVSRAGLRVVRTASSASARLDGGFPPPSLRQGLCRVAPIARVPAKSHWSWNLTGRSNRRLLQAAVRDQAHVHFVVDAVRLMDSPAAGLRQVEQLLADAVVARDANQLALGTLADVARRMQPVRVRRQSHSILRAA